MVALVLTAITEYNSNHRQRRKQSHTDKNTTCITFTCIYAIVKVFRPTGLKFECLRRILVYKVIVYTTHTGIVIIIPVVKATQ